MKRNKKRYDENSQQKQEQTQTSLTPKEIYKVT